MKNMRNNESRPITLGQGKQILNLLSQQGLNSADVNTLCDGYFPDMLKAIKLGVLPSREAFHKFVGLGPLFERDQSGRIIITFTGTGFLANEWVARSIESGFYFTEWALDALAFSDYDRRHRLKAGQSYSVLLLRSSEMVTSCQSENHLQISIDHDYTQSMTVCAELVFLARELLSNEVMKRMNISRITALHEPVIASNKAPFIFVSSCLGRDREISVAPANEESRWTDADAFLCPLSV